MYRCKYGYLGVHRGRMRRLEACMKIEFRVVQKMEFAVE